MQYSRWLLAFAGAVAIIVGAAFQWGPHAEAAEASGTPQPKGPTEPLVTLTFGSTEVGGTVLPPHQVDEGGSAINLSTEWLFAGVVREESRYAYIATSHPTNREAPSEILPVDYWNEFGPKPSTPKLTTTLRQYGTGINHPDVDVGYFAARNHLVIDEVQLDPNVGMLNVTNSIDVTHSWESNAGGFEASVYDAEHRVGYFGRNSGQAEMALLLMGPQDAGALDRVMVDPNAERIVSLAVGDPGDYLFALVADPPAIVTLTRAVPPLLPVVVSRRSLAPDMSGTPIALSADAADGHLFVYTGGVDDNSQQIGKYTLDAGTGDLEYLGTFTLSAAPGNVMLHDRDNNWLYVVGKTASSMNIHRIHAGVGDGLPFVEVESLDTEVLSTTRIKPINWGFLTGDNGNKKIK